MVFRTPFFVSWLYPGLVWRIKTDRKEIFLTFDDGPVPGPTEFVLDELAKYKARATFFCIGDNVRKHPEIFKKIIEGGHAFGNHTFNHYKGWNYSVEDYTANTALCRDAFVSNIPEFENQKEKLFRPPYGKIKRAQIRALSPEYKIVMWDVLTGDYDAALSAEKCLKGSVDAARPGSVIVFHDSIKAQKNMTYVLPRLLEHFSRLGYSFHSIPFNG